MALSLEIVEGPQAGLRVPLTGPVVAGRDDDVDVRVEDRLVSRRHARITPAGDGALVEDLGSLNGTLVNDDEVHGTTQIAPGDEISIGVTILKLRTDEQVALQPTAVRRKPPPLAVAARQPDYVPPAVLGDPARDGSDLDPLLDVHVKAKARTAALAVFNVAVFAVLIFLATR